MGRKDIRRLIFEMLDCAQSLSKFDGNDSSAADGSSLGTSRDDAKSTNTGASSS